ncbi:hypothetical protein O4J55_29935, partial [Paracoccus sp. PXZ]
SKMTPKRPCYFREADAVISLSMVGLWRKRSDHHYLSRPAIAATSCVAEIQDIHQINYLCQKPTMALLRMAGSG